MDPLSIIAATVGTADVAFRLGRFLKRTIQGARNDERDLLNLLNQVETLSSITNGITSITCAHGFEQTLRRSFRETGSLAKPWEQLWHDTERISKEIKRLLEKLEAVLKYIQGDDRDAAEGNSTDEASEQSPQAGSVRARNSPYTCISDLADEFLIADGIARWNISSVSTFC